MKIRNKRIIYLLINLVVRVRGILDAFKIINVKLLFVD